jgi:hypothetical protein
MAIDGKARRQLNLAGQAASGYVGTVTNLGGQGVGNLPPHGHAAASTGAACNELSECHGIFL